MDKLAWIALAFVAALGAAGVTICGSVGLSKVDSTLATALRAVIMAIALVAFALLTGKLRPLADGTASLSAAAWGFIVLAGLCGAISWLAYFAALQLGPAGPVAAIDRMSLVLVFLFAALFLGERHGWRGWVGVALIVLGVLLLLAERSPAARPTPPDPAPHTAPDA